MSQTGEMGISHEYRKTNGDGKYSLVAIAEHIRKQHSSEFYVQTNAQNSKF